MTAVRLNLINHSNDTNNSHFVIFSKNEADSFADTAIAWQVISNLGHEDYHPFNYPLTVTVAASDSYGNYTPQMQAYPGDAFAMTKDSSGDVLTKLSAPATAPDEYELHNQLRTGAIDALVYRDGKLFASKTSLAPGQKAVFSFKPTIFIGAASEIVEEEVMNSAIISDFNTELSLLGIAAADIVIRGGGSGAEATPFSFALENVVMA